jgi:hypothetical protein
VIVFNLSRAYASIELLKTGFVSSPALILGIGGVRPTLKPEAFRVLRDPYRRWGIAGGWLSERSLQMRLSAEGHYEARSFPDSRCGNPLVVEFTIQKASGSWDALTLEITKVTEPLPLSALSRRHLVVRPDSKLKLQFQRLGTLSPVFNLDGEEEIPEVTSRFERLDSVEIDE